jgi:hypothetical protein
MKILVNYFTSYSKIIHNRIKVLKHDIFSIEFLLYNIILM